MFIHPVSREESPRYAIPPRRGLCVWLRGAHFFLGAYLIRAGLKVDGVWRHTAIFSYVALVLQGVLVNSSRGVEIPKTLTQGVAKALLC